MPEPTFDLAKAHRWFGVECNNTAWGLLEQPARTADETEQLLHAAHTALHHWAHIGTMINRLRGLSLLATAYIAAGRAEEATRWATACLALSDRLGMPEATADQHDADGQTSFDRACSHACAAAAFRLAEFADKAAEQERLSRSVLIDCDKEECEVVEKFYGISP